MRRFGLTLSLSIFALAAAVFAVVPVAGSAQAGEQLPNINSLPVGFRFCPAPGADNTEFNSSYYAVDAQTGRMERYVDGQPHHELEPVDTEEKILLVLPSVDVENRYVPYPGAAPQQPPAEFANSDHGYNPNRAPQPGPGYYQPQQPMAPVIPQPAYAQPQQRNDQQYAHRQQPQKPGQKKKPRAIRFRYNNELH